VFLQLINQINARRLDDKLNIFEGIHKNPLTIGIFFGEIIVQTILTEFGRDVFSLSYKVFL